jgi:hypothetical protein
MPRIFSGEAIEPLSALVPSSQVPGVAAIVAVTGVVAAFYLVIGYRLSQRRVSPGSRLATGQLAMWWGGLGADLAVGAAELVVALAGGLTFATAMSFYLVTIIVIVAALWGLTGFLVYVYTGHYHLVWVCTIYIAFYVTFLFWFFSESPYAIAIEAGSVVWQYSGTPNLVVELVLVLLLLVPEIAAAGLYLSLLRRTRDPAPRYRIALVGGGILLWFGIDILLPGSTVPWVIVRTGLLVIPALMSFSAYYPPAWARRRYGVTAIETEDTETVNEAAVSS